MIKKTILTFLFFLISQFVFSQTGLEKRVEDINKEGISLYFLEKSSWASSDLLMERFNHSFDNIGGYFSYSHNGKFTTLFFRKDNVLMTYITMEFDSIFDFGNVIIDTISRELTFSERNLLEIRESAIHEINENEVIKSYENTSFNIIPIVYKGKRKVYIITATEQKGKIIFGNDYLLHFNRKNKIKKIDALHKGILVFDEKDIIDTWLTHTHHSDYNPLMTVTDVCTLLLYGEYSSLWQNHVVISEEYVSIWNYSNKRFIVMKSEVYFNLKI